MDDFPGPNPSRLDALATREETLTVNHGYSKFIRSMRIVLPLLAVVMTVVVLTWDEAGRHVEPLKKEQVAPKEENIRNELVKPVFNSVDDKGQPFMVTADSAVQDKTNPDLLNLAQPRAQIDMTDGAKVNADATSGIYQQKDQKLNLAGNVHLKHSDGYTLSTEEMRVDLVTKKAFSGRDVHVDGPAGTIDSTGLEGDANTGVLVFTGPAKVVLYSDNLSLSPQEKTP